MGNDINVRYNDIDEAIETIIGYTNQMLDYLNVADKDMNNTLTIDTFNGPIADSVSNGWRSIRSEIEKEIMALNERINILREMKSSYISTDDENANNMRGV